MIALLAAIALAKPSCEGPRVTGTVPSAGATAVPIDVRLAAVFDDDGCQKGAGWTLTLTRADDGTVVAESAAGEEQVVETALLELFPPVLAPTTEYVLAIASEFDGVVVEVGFTTGEGLVVGLDGAPVLTEAVADWQRMGPSPGTGGVITLEWSAQPVADPDSLSLLQLVDGAMERDPDTRLAGNVPASTSWQSTRRPDDVCPKVRQIDGKGVATAFSEPICVAAGRGCDTSGRPADVGVAALLVAVLLRRSRPPTRSPAVPR